MRKRRPKSPTPMPKINCPVGPTGPWQESLKAWPGAHQQVPGLPQKLIYAYRFCTNRILIFCLPPLRGPVYSWLDIDAEPQDKDSSLTLLGAISVVSNQSLAGGETSMKSGRVEHKAVNPVQLKSVISLAPTIRRKRAVPEACSRAFRQKAAATPHYCSSVALALLTLGHVAVSQASRSITKSSG